MEGPVIIYVEGGGVGAGGGGRNLLEISKFM